MTKRNEALQAFADASFVAFDKYARDAKARQSIDAIFAALQSPATESARPRRRLPVCSELDQALAIDPPDATLSRVVGCFKAIEPLLEWRRRTAVDGNASANFDDGHANAMVFGPGGLEPRNDVWLGATLMAPNVRYPDHTHAPEEVYLVLTEGEFRQADGPWFSPGLGGSFYNPSGIRHAMRSVDAPFFAFWALQV